MKTIKDLENMKSTSCAPFRSQYDYLFARLEDYILKADGLSRIEEELNQWDDDAKKVIAEKLVDMIYESEIIGFDKNEILSLIK